MRSERKLLNPKEKYYAFKRECDIANAGLVSDITDYVEQLGKENDILLRIIQLLTDDNR